jgi:hypothetical protein
MVSMLQSVRMWCNCADLDVATVAVAVEAIVAFVKCSMGDGEGRAGVLGPATVAHDHVWHGERTQALQRLLDIHEAALGVIGTTVGPSSSSSNTQSGSDSGLAPGAGAGREGGSIGMLGS